MFLLLLITLSMAVTNVSAAVDADAISVEPPTAIILAIDDTVTVNITITNIQNCAGYMFKIDYNSTLLALDSWTFDTGTPLSPTQVAPASGDRVDTDASFAGSVQLATVWKTGQPTYNGSGLAAQLTFNGTMLGNSTLIFDQLWTLASDDIGSEIHFLMFNDGYIEVVPEFPAAILMSLVLTATLASAFLAKIAWSKKQRRS